MLKIVEALISDISSSLLGKLRTAINSVPSYETFTKTIDIPSLQKDMKKIIEESFHETASLYKLRDIPQKELREAVFTNIDLLFSWCITPQTVFNSDEINITNYDYKNELLIFFKSLHEQFIIKKDLFPSFGTIQIKSLLYDQNVKLDMQTGILNIIQGDVSDIQHLLESQKINEHWSFFQEFSEIESKISNREFTSALNYLNILEIKISQNNKIDEKEKFYELYTNAYLADVKKQKRAIPYLEKLIRYTEKPIRTMQRKILLLVLDENYDKAFEQNKNMLAQELSVKDRQYFLELAVNIYFLKNQFEEAQKFLDSIKTEFEKYLLWQIRLLIAKSLYVEAANLIEKNNDFFTESYNKKLIRVETFCYAATEEYCRDGTSEARQKEIESLVQECNDLLDKSADDTGARETLLVCNGFFYRMLHNLDKSLEAYTELERMNSNNPNFLRNYPFALLLKPDSTNRGKAIIYFKKYLDLYPQDSLIREAYFQALVQDNLKQAMNEIENFQEDKTTINAKMQLAEAYTKNLDLLKTDSFISTMEIKYSGHWAILTARGDYFCAKQEIEKALCFYREALEKGPDMIHRLDLINKIVSIDLMVPNQINVNECIKLFNSIQNEYELLVTFGHKYIYALIAGGNISYAVQQIKKMRKYGLLTPDIIREQIWCNYSDQNYQSVIELTNELKKYELLNSKDILVYIISQLAIGKAEESSAAFDLLPEPETEQEFIIRQNLVRTLGNREKELEIAHNGYLRYPNSIPLMENFIMSIFCTKNKISEDIYTDARECRDKYFKLDENKRHIKAISIPENADGMEILKCLQQAIPVQRSFDYIKFLENNHLHISFLAIKKFNYLYIWESSRYLSDMHIYSSNGNFEVIRKEYDAATTDKAIIDLPSLVTCAYLGVLDYLPKLFSTIYVSQQSVTELQEVIQTKTDPLLPNCYSCFYLLNENKYPEKPLPLQEEIVNIAVTLKDFINKNTIRIVGRQLEPVKQLPAEWEKDFRSYSFIESETIIYGYESNIPIMLESFLYRALLQSDRNAPPVFEIESVLNRLLQEKKITRIEYILFVCKLIQSDYQAITFNARFLFILVQYYGFTDSKYSNKIFSLLEATNVYNKNWAFETILMPFLAILWNTYIPEAPKIFWTEKTLSALAKRGDILFSDVHIYMSVLYRIITMYQSKEWLRKYWNTNVKQIKSKFESIESKNDNKDMV
ncbi:MAG: hypothetical protein WCR31_03750 [Treponema sp.]